MELNTILVAVIIIVITIIVKLSNLTKYVTGKLHMYNTVKNLPGPKCYPLIGNMLSFRGDVSDITDKLLQFYKTYELPGRIWLGLKLFVVVDDPEHIKIIEESNHANEKSEMYEFFKPIFGNGLIPTSASTAKIHRKLLNPIFHEQILSTYIEKIVKISNRLVRVLESFNEQEIDISKYIQLCNVTMIYDIFLGKDLDFLENLDFKFNNLLSSNKILITMLNGILFILLNKGTNSTPFLKTLFKSFYEGGEYTEQDIRDEMKTLILAGSDTSSNTITFALVMLASYPAIQYHDIVLHFCWQEKLYQELYNIYGSTDFEDIRIAYQDIKQMNFLERFIKETLRVFPSVPFIGRNVSEDIKVNDDFTIPKNSNIVFFIYALHHNKKFWKNPEEFNPDRFLPGNYNSEFFKPFGYGRRSCIGQKFAMYQMKIIIATILRKFIVKMDHPKNLEDIRLIFGITMKTSETVLLRFINR
ncbi:hypothetical protein M0802_006442 [Mischocyttarus mexicanus]|nr:hypothetical protein M0802_006442 [Mischocyttarus mexicanus]